MISKKMADAVNTQIAAEFYSSYMYLSMAAYFAEYGLDGFAAWMKMQAQEELAHGMKFFNHVNERDGRVCLGAIDSPPSDWESPLAVFDATLNHERKVTSMINDLVTIAKEEKDYASENFLQWFISEQVEEEASAKGLLDRLRMIDGSPQGMFMMDREMGQRTFALPAAGDE